MFSARRLPSTAYDGLKSLTKRLVDSIGDYDAAAGFTRVKPTMLHNYANKAMPDVFAPIDVIADLESVDGKPLVTAQLARILHHQLLPLDAAGQGTDHRAIAEVLCGAAQLAAEWSAALEDTRITDAERAALLERLCELRRAVERAVSLMTPPDRVAAERLRPIGLVA